MKQLFLLLICAFCFNICNAQKGSVPNLKPFYVDFDSLTYIRVTDTIYSDWLRDGHLLDIVYKGNGVAWMNRDSSLIIKDSLLTIKAMIECAYYKLTRHKK